MTETFAARENTPFPANPGETPRAGVDPLEGDWAEGLRAPLRENAIPKPARHGVQAAAAQATAPLAHAGAGTAQGGSLRTEQLDLSSLAALGSLEAPRELAPEVEAPEAWAGAEEDQLASVPPPPRDAGKEEVLLLSDAELADDGELDAGTAADAHAESGPQAAAAEGPTPVETGALATGAGSASSESTPVTTTLSADAQSASEAGAAASALGAAGDDGSAAPSGSRGEPLSGSPAEATSDAQAAAETLSPSTAPGDGNRVDAPGRAGETIALDAQPLADAGASPLEEQIAAQLEAQIALQMDEQAPHEAAAPEVLPDEAIHELLEPLEVTAAPTASMSSAGGPALAEAVALLDHDSRAPAEALEPHEVAWEAAVNGSSPGAEKALHIETLDAASVIGGDPWSPGAGQARESAPAAGASEPAQAVPLDATLGAQAWSDDLGGDAIDWAPALAPSRSAANAAPTAAAWQDPGGAQVASGWSSPGAAREPVAAAPAPDASGWSDDSVWDAKTVFAAALPSLLARSAPVQDWSAAPEADWATPSAPSSAGSRPTIVMSDSPFAPLPPGASLSGDDEPAPGEPELTELSPSDLEPLPDEPELLVPLESTPGHLLDPVALPGQHRVAVQTRGGESRRGVLHNPDLTAPEIALHPVSGGPPELIALSEVKAILFLLEPGESGHRGDGGRVRVTFIDGRTLEGERDGLDAREGFFIVPLDAAQTNTRRIFVARAALLEIAEG